MTYSSNSSVVKTHLRVSSMMMTISLVVVDLDKASEEVFSITIWEEA